MSLDIYGSTKPYVLDFFLVNYGNKIVELIEDNKWFNLGGGSGRRLWSERKSALQHPLRVQQRQVQVRHRRRVRNDRRDGSSGPRRTVHHHCGGGGHGSSTEQKVCISANDFTAPTPPDMFKLGPHCTGPKPRLPPGHVQVGLQCIGPFPSMFKLVHYKA